METIVDRVRIRVFSTGLLRTTVIVDHTGLTRRRIWGMGVGSEVKERFP